MPDMSLCVNNVKQAFNKTRLGGLCMVNICAQGETMLPPQMIEIIKSILENGHYVMVVTNGTLKKRFEEVCSFPEELRKRLFFKFSFHYLELMPLSPNSYLEKGYEVYGMIRRSSVDFRERIAHLEGKPHFHLVYGDLADAGEAGGTVSKYAFWAEV